jgi:hypothetical protein
LIEELLEQQTIPGCEKIFDYIESRKTKLTVVRIGTRIDVFLIDDN